MSLIWKGWLWLHQWWAHAVRLNLAGLRALSINFTIFARRPYTQCPHHSIVCTETLSLNTFGGSNNSLWRFLSCD